MTDCIIFSFYLFINNQLHKRDTEDQGKNQPVLPFCSAEGAQRTFVKYSFAIRTLFSKTKVCSGCCKLS